MYNYILEGKTPVVEPDLLKWAEWFEKNDRYVEHTVLPGGVEVSTIFLGLDYSFGGGEPLLFETMIFGGDHNRYQRRYATWKQAEAGHQEAIELVFA
jgi:hypothetical protein